MANALYGLGRESFLKGDTDVDGNIKFQFQDSGVYTLDIDVHDFEDDLAAEIGISANLSSKTTTLGVFDAADETVSTVTGHEFEYIVLYEDSGTPATSPLICCIDTATGLPCTPNGGDIIVQWDSGANKIFKL